MILLLALTLPVAGCGGENDSAPDEQALAREAVAGYMEALGQLDPVASCAALTEQAQDEVAQAVSDAPNTSNSDECVSALEGLWASATAVPPSDEAEAFIEDVRDGRAVKSGPITTSIDGDTGTVTFDPDPRGFEIEVEKVDDTWLVSNGTPLLFDFGVDEVP